MNKNPKIESLDSTIWLVQLDRFTNKFDTEMNKENQRIKKWLKIGGIPLIISIGVSIITLSYIPVIIGTTYFGAISIVKTIKDGIEEEKRIKQKYSIEKNTPFKQEPQTPDFDFLYEPIITVKAEDFHSDYIKERLSEVAKKQRFTVVDSKGNVIGGVEEQEQEQEEEYLPLNKEETMIQVSDEYRVYKKVYNLPDLTITNKEWDILFDTVFHKLEETCTEDKFYDYMSFLLRYVIAYALVNKKQEINYLSFINQLNRLEIIGMKKEDIRDIEKKIRSTLPKTKIIPIDFKSLKKTQK